MYSRVEYSARCISRYRWGFRVRKMGDARRREPKKKKKKKKWWFLILTELICGDWRVLCSFMPCNFSSMPPYVPILVFSIYLCPPLCDGRSVSIIECYIRMQLRKVYLRRSKAELIDSINTNHSIFIKSIHIYIDIKKFKHSKYSSIKIPKLQRYFIILSIRSI